MWGGVSCSAVAARALTSCRSVTDLGDSRDTLGDFFDPKRSALHREAVAAAAGGASQRQLRDEGDHDQEEPREDHCGFTVGLQEAKPEEGMQRSKH